ncbi:MAG: CHRD domain-containing protein [Nitrospiraceae bacterium]|nr:CHRD domain-containing protein [Nitrospiraceae bacterium]
MKKKTLLIVPVAIMFLLSCLAITAFAQAQFSTTLEGKNEAPPVKTGGTGKIVFRFWTGAEIGEIGLDYTLDVKDIKDVTSAHIHLGKPGESGPAVVVLFSGPEKKGAFTGTLAHGRIVSSDLVGPLEGKTVADLMHEIVEGNAYVNVHTVAHPGGEVRGQLKCPKDICPAPFWRK